MNITKEQWTKRAPGECGCDCWNPDHICRQVWKQYPEALQAQAHVSTGLWADVTVTLPGHVTLQIRV